MPQVGEQPHRCSHDCAGGKQPHWCSLCRAIASHLLMVLCGRLFGLRTRKLTKRMLTKLGGFYHHRLQSLLHKSHVWCFVNFYGCFNLLSRKLTHAPYICTSKHWLELFKKLVYLRPLSILDVTSCGIQLANRRPVFGKQLYSVNTHGKDMQ